MSTALVTGATGFIGERLVRVLRAKGQRVIALVRKTSRTDVLRELGAELAYGDMGDLESIHAAAREADVIYHLASLLKMPWKEAFFSINVRGSDNVARAGAASKKAPVLIVVSSLAAAGPSPAERPRDESDVPQPVSAYGRMKLSCEAAALAWADELALTVVRPPMVLGEGDKPSLPLFRMANRGLQLVPDANARVAMVHVEDLAQLLHRAARKGERASANGGEGRGVYFAAHPRQPTVAEFGHMLARACGRERVRCLRPPRPLLWGAASVSEAFARLRDKPVAFNLDKCRELTSGSWICNPDKAIAGLGIVQVDIEQRLQATAQWYREKRLL